LAKAYAMQCFSSFVGSDGDRQQDWNTKWKEVAIEFHGYQGLNVLTVDTK
jgi:hypothetical protein